MFTMRLKTGGEKIALFEGSYDDCMALAHAIERFPLDYIEVEVYNSETLETKYRHLSPKWL